MADNLWKRATESLPIRALMCFAGCAGIGILGQIVRGPVSGMPFVPYWLKVALFYTWLGVCCLLGLGFLCFLLFGLAAQRRERKAAEKRRRVNAHLHMAVQMSSELAATAGTSQFPAALERFYRFLFYCIPQVLSPGSEIRRLALFVPDTESDDPPTHLRVEQACEAFPADYADRLRLPVTGSVAGKVYRTGKSYRAGRDDPEFWEVPDDPMQNYETVMCSPAVLQGEVVAVLSIDHSEREAFSDEDQDHFELFARQFALVWALSHPAQKDQTADAE
jgi:hypothetical protein